MREREAGPRAADDDVAATVKAARGMAPEPLPSGFAAIDWSKPWFAQFAARGQRWQQAALAGYANLLAEMNADAARIQPTTGRGQRLAFIAQDDLPPGAAYEGHIASTGCVPTRHNLHDFFNGSMWFAFPRIKAALNARQSAELDVLGVGPTRGGVRDMLTLFDENALLFACADPSLCAALHGFDWQTLFVARRDAWGRGCEVRCFGHALLEKLIAPFKGCTGHAWIVEVPPNYFEWDPAARNAWLDEAVSAALLGTDALTSRMFAPLPVLGIPGWWPENESPTFYDDTSVFRAGRRKR
ncbi:MULTISPECIES: DUF3025 domain-containing protein [Paraburkholderia]|uniref:DUF3025 domain-containing protein n=1 Tax=Paraburkholderia podalyriae TaxID=1938811 RepID=A0ABR7PRD1_9BURK|nr:DUF3025 domain-containing protein [Paraburkholderia podalyriae]MBC8748824.1 DUF3025 domain-containing protein [Paraburkholderia podalyriae]